MSFLRFFTWTIIALFLIVSAGLYWKSRGENKGQAAETVNVTVPGPAPSILVAHWTFDGNDVVWGDTNSEVKDVSGNNYHGNALGSLAAGSAVIGTSGQGLQFNGSSDYVDAGTNIDSTGTKTVSLWFKELGNEDTLFFSSTGSTSDYIHIAFYNADTISVVVEDTYPSSKSRQVDGLDIGQWYHIVVTKTSAGVTGIYVNGIESSYAGGDFLPFGNTDITYIGRNPSGGYFEGSIDDVRIYNTALSATQVADLYRSSGAKQTINFGMEGTLTDGLVGHWTMDGNDVIWGDTSSEVKDRSGNGNDGDAVGLTASSAVIGKLGQALSFNGTGDYVDIAENNNLPIYASSSAQSIVFWIKASPSGSIPAEVTVFSEGPSAGNSFPHFRLNDIGNSTLHVDLRNNGGGIDIDASSTANVFDSVWHHIAWVDNNGMAKLYIDGAQDATDFTYTRSSLSSITQTGIGYEPEWGVTDSISGSLDDFRIYNRALSATEVLDFYKNGR